ncbi:MAG: TfoX/Sxy family protein [Clostridia bacterium]|nr:TfoX/Sxy family protein [Clostridia bacterium]
MASTKEYLDYVLEQLSEPGAVSYRKMMGEYVIYHDGKVVGGIYDDRLLVKPTDAGEKIMSQSPFGLHKDLPYKGAKEMIVADIDDGELTRSLIRATAQALAGAK